MLASLTCSAVGVGLAVPSACLPGSAGCCCCPASVLVRQNANNTTQNAISIFRFKAPSLGRRPTRSRETAWEQTLGEHEPVCHAETIYREVRVLPTVRTYRRVGSRA